jgi:hypothetical protein
MIRKFWGRKHEPTQVLEWKYSSSQTQKKVRQADSKVNSKHTISLTSVRMFIKNLSWQDKQSILHITVHLQTEM